MQDVQLKSELTNVLNVLIWQKKVEIIVLGFTSLDPSSVNSKTVYA